MSEYRKLSEQAWPSRWGVCRKCLQIWEVDIPRYFGGLVCPEPGCDWKLRTFKEKERAEEEKLTYTELEAEYERIRTKGPHHE